jgi:hypothetical protein
MNNFNLYFESVCADLIVESVQDIKDKLTSMGWKYAYRYIKNGVRIVWIWWLPLKDKSGYYLCFCTEFFSKYSNPEAEEDNGETKRKKTFAEKAFDLIYPSYLLKAVDKIRW